MASREEYFSNHSNYKKIRQGFLDFGVRIGELLGEDNSTVLKGMTAIYNLESQLAKVRERERERERERKGERKMDRQTERDRERLFFVPYRSF